jgi:hypothetical protein
VLRPQLGGPARFYVPIISGSASVVTRVSGRLTGNAGTKKSAAGAPRQIDNSPTLWVYRKSMLRCQFEPHFT